MTQIWHSVLILFLAFPALAGPALNPEVTQATIFDTICAPGYTLTVRPPSYATRAIKRTLLAEAGWAPLWAPFYELDHVVPLSLGGAALDPSNLALQPRLGAWRKNRLERKLQCLVCTGRLSLGEAQAAIAGDWIGTENAWAGTGCRRTWR